jgi:tetraacyldisaccharide 4'-kinase
MQFQSILAKILLFPFALLYGVGVSLRNFLYQSKVIRSVSFDVPVIAVGNLSVGGAGKTPHIEYLIELLQPYLSVATLSRGYKRKTEGFIAVVPEHTALQVGDEPLQYKRKYPDVFVTVGEDRAFAIPKLMMQKPDTQVILLDDAFQHRAVRPYLNILLTEYAKPYYEDALLPVGRLREWTTGAKRADVIVVTKCPNSMTLEDKNRIIKGLAPEANQRIFFSYYDYPRAPYYILNSQYSANLHSKLDILMVSGIARADYLIDSLNPKVNSVRLMEFADHHFFSNSDIAQIKRVFDSIVSENKIILTTEKDAVRFQLHFDYLVKEQIPIFALPTKVAFHFDETATFNAMIKEQLLAFRA